MRVNNKIRNRQIEIASQANIDLSEFVEPVIKFDDYIFDVNFTDEAREYLRKAHSAWRISHRRMELVERVVKAIIEIEDCVVANKYHVDEALKHINY